MESHFESQPREMNRNPPTKGQLPLICIKGMLMGVCDSVPGVSGGTIAVAANIYDRIINAIGAVDAEALRLLLSGRPRQFWRRVDGAFLLTLGLGIAGGLLLSANLILYLIENYPEPLRAFFIGLIIAAAGLLRAEASARDWRNILPALGGALLVLLVSMAAPNEARLSMVYLFICGMIAVSAMLLPGLSGAFILILLGAYNHMLAALANLDIPVLLVFLAGCALGAALMSRILGWLLLSHRRFAYAFIRGMLVGSIPALWPWQLAPDANSAAQFLGNRPVWPAEHLELSGREPMVLLCLAALAAGLCLTVAARRRFRPRA